MQAKGQLFQVREGEMGLVIVLGLLLMINSMALELADVVAVSGFLANVSVSDILWVWIIDMLLIAGAASIQTLIVDRFHRIRVLRFLIVGFIAAYVILRLLFMVEAIPVVINYALLFLLVEQQWIFFPLIFWVLANDIFESAEARRLFPLIAAFSFIGQIAGLTLGSLAPELLARWGWDHAEPLTFNAMIYGVAFLLVMFGLRNIKLRRTGGTSSQGASFTETIGEGVKFVREVSAFRYLMIAMLAVALVVTISDYHFLVSSDQAFGTSSTFPGSFQTFYGLYRLVVTVIAIAIQTLVTGRLIEKFELKNMFWVLPIAMFIAVSVMMAPLLAFVVLGRAIFRVVHVSVDEPARKALYSLVPDERRGRVSVFMDSYLFVGGVIIGCLFLLLILFVSPLIGLDRPAWIYLPLGAVASLIALWAVWKMRQSYDTSILNWRLRRRSRGAKVLDGIDF